MTPIIRPGYILNAIERTNAESKREISGADKKRKFRSAPRHVNTLQPSAQTTHRTAIAFSNLRTVDLLDT